MSDFPGSIVTFSLRATPYNRTSSFAHGADESNEFPLSVTSSPIGGASAGATAGSSAHRTGIAGNLVQMFGGNLFERIIVTPRVKNVAIVLSATQFPVEVWNTFHDAAQTLTAIAITGTGGITITNPYGLPKTIGPKDSIILEALIPSSGDVTIAQGVAFVFSGISGTDVVVTGGRILVFSVPADFQEGVEETLSYLTDVFKSYDDSEQRRGLRSLPRRSLKYRAVTLEARDAAGMESLLWGWQHEAYGVPFWQDAQLLEADIGVGNFTIQVNTVDRLFAVGGIAMLWTDEFTFEAFTLSSMTADSITFAAPTQFAWKAGAKVVPIFLGRLANSVELSRLACFSDQVDVEFQGEALQIGPAPSVSPVQFKGFDVLETPPNWANELKRNYARSTISLDPRTGPITVDDKGGTAIVSHELPWWIDSHAGVTALRAFLVRRYGQLVPFWAPTWDQDLVMSSDTAAGSAVLNIRTVYYTRFFFRDRSRRFLALIPIGAGAIRYVEVTGSEDNGNGTESLTLSAAIGADVIAASTMVSFLTFCRLASDDLKIIWYSTEAAEATVPIQEIPRELPA
jgi:hypothetical protein